MKHYGLTLNLKDDPKIIEQYKVYHQEAWPETLAGLKAVGITKMNIYLIGRRLFMAMETVDTFDIKRDFPVILRNIQNAKSGINSCVLFRNLLMKHKQMNGGLKWNLCLSYRYLEDVDTFFNIV